MTVAMALGTATGGLTLDLAFAATALHLARETHMASAPQTDLSLLLDVALEGTLTIDVTPKPPPAILQIDGTEGPAILHFSFPATLTLDANGRPV